MCGISGWVRADSLAIENAQNLACHLSSAIQHRGPDGSGYYRTDDMRIGLVHKRLAIIDPSSRADQPLIDAETNAAITYNGEIYNYKMLREELIAKDVKFYTTSDTEVILKGYLNEGVEFFRKLRGMYAFAIWDPRDCRVVALRDPLGIKPLYVRTTNAGVLFGSSASGIASVAPSCDIDPAAAVSFVALGCIIDPLTNFRGVRMMEPGVAHLWSSRGGAVVERRVAIRPIFAVTADPDHPQWDFLEAAIGETVAAHFESDVDVGVFQSAGADSTLISSLAQRKGFNPLLITLGFKEFEGSHLDEVSSARTIADSLGLRHIGTYLSRNDFEIERQKYLDAMDSPTTDGINTYFVSLASRQAGVKVALSGVGGDELFAGYPSFKLLPKIHAAHNLLGARFLRSGVNWVAGRVAANPKQAPKLKFFTNYLDPFSRVYLFKRAIFPFELMHEVLDQSVIDAGLPGFMEAYDALTKGSEAGDQAAVRQLELNVYLRNMLLKDADWAGMAHGVEIRTPFVDLVFSRSMKDSANRCGYTKADLYRTLRQIAELNGVQARKTGFSVPYQHWFLADHQAGNGVFNRSSRAIQSWARVVLNAKFPGFGRAMN